MAALAPVTWVVDADAFVLVKPEPMSDPEPSINCKREGPAPSSEYPGVKIMKVTGKWRATVRESGMHIFHRTFDTREEAIAAIDMYSFDKTIPPCKTGGPKSTVTWLDKRHKWMVTFRKDGNRPCVRSFETVEQAQQTKAKYDFDGTISPIIKERPRPYYEPCLKRKRGGGAVLSATPGVSWNKQAKKWTAYFTDGNGKRFHLGKYFDKEEAIKVAAPYYQRQRSTSKWLGLAWDSSVGDGGRWVVVCKHKYIGRFKFEDEEAAARAYNVEAKRIGLTELNDVPDAPVISKKDRFFKKVEKGQLYE